MDNDIVIYPYDDEPNEGVATRGYCTVDASDEHGKRVIYNALSGAIPLSAEMDKALQIRDIMLQPGTRRSRETGDIENVVNVYLIDVNGVAYFSQSLGVFRSVSDLLTLYPDGFSGCENGFLLLKCVERKMYNGNTIKRLVLA